MVHGILHFLPDIPPTLSMCSDVTNSTATMTLSSKVQDMAATACSHTSVGKIRLVVVITYTARDFMVISGYLQHRFQVLALN